MTYNFEPVTPFVPIGSLALNSFSPFDAFPFVVFGVFC